MPKEQSQPTYEETLKAYRYLSGLREETENERKKPSHERFGYGFESDYHLKRLREFVDATELLLSLPQEMRKRLEEDFKIENFDNRLTQLVLENSC